MLDTAAKECMQSAMVHTVNTLNKGPVTTHMRNIQHSYSHYCRTSNTRNTFPP
jgi:hypothetical protein